VTYLPRFDTAVRPNDEPGGVSGNSMDNLQVATDKNVITELFSRVYPL
jgi:hypothetical protein